MRLSAGSAIDESKEASLSWQGCGTYRRNSLERRERLPRLLSNRFSRWPETKGILGYPCDRTLGRLKNLVVELTL
jgi:hypothetical protein